MDKRVYISGKITGLPFDEVVDAFEAAGKQIEAWGYTPVDPTLIQIYDLTYEEYMRIDFVLLESCDAIYMMKNWGDSPGARRELEHAQKIGKEIIYER